MSGPKNSVPLLCPGRGRRDYGSFSLRVPCTLLFPDTSFTPGRASTNSNCPWVLSPTHPPCNTVSDTPEVPESSLLPRHRDPVLGRCLPESPPLLDPSPDHPPPPPTSLGSLRLHKSDRGLRVLALRTSLRSRSVGEGTVSEVVGEGRGEGREGTPGGRVGWGQTYTWQCLYAHDPASSPCQQSSCVLSSLVLRVLSCNRPSSLIVSVLTSETKQNEFFVTINLITRTLLISHFL